MPVADIDAAIAQCSDLIAIASYDGVTSLYDQMVLWNNGMFLESGIFKPSLDGANNPGQRVVTDWYAASLMALDDIEGPSASDSGVVGTSAVINAVVRELFAVKYGVTNSQVTSAQQTATVALFNVCWP